MKILLLIFSFFLTFNTVAEEQNQFVFETEPPVDCLEDYRQFFGNKDSYGYEDYCVHKASAGNIITIDVRVKEGVNQTVFYIPYSSIRHEGVLIQVYYNPGPFGKSQWFLMPYSKGIALFPGSITLPINQWVSEGLTIGGWVRAVILTSQEDELKVSEEPYSIPKDDPLFIDFSNIPEKRGDGRVYVGDDMDFDIGDYID